MQQVTAPMSDRKILVVDDEVANLDKLRRTFVNRYPVLAAASGMDALELIRKNEDIAVIIADQRMPGMTGVEFLRQSLELLPDAIRIILTGYTDVDVLMDAINSCKVYRYIVKPWDPPDLLMTVERGLEAQRLALENVRFRKELIRRERLARELEIAREIQRYILPPECPSPDGWEMAVDYSPAREVGGDLYDFDWNPGTGTLQIVIGDVSGKSIPAALYGAVFSGQIRALLAQSMSPAEILAFLNGRLLARYQVANFIAVACARVDLTQGTCLLANAGMPFPHLIRGQGISRLMIPGVPLGLLEGTTYDEMPLRLERGDLLVLASDGTTDVMDPGGQLYGISRFLDSIRQHSGEGIAQFVRSLSRGIRDFAAGADPSDDITIVALRRRT